MQLPGEDYNKSSYSLSARILHYLALGIPMVSKVSFDLDCIGSNPTHVVKNGHHVFISGLARSGSTILTRLLYESELFRSLNYRDMPFVLMPRMWNKVINKSFKAGALKERPHSDGIMVDFESPEALEEVFWKVFARHEYISVTSLYEHRAKEDLIARFRQYISNILASNTGSSKSRYLSKNNNNVVRLGSIQESFPQAQILIPFRDPLQQASSLLEQHGKFLKMHEGNRFSLKYMNWLGHYEFGLNHRPFDFSGSDAMEKSRFTANDINYWVAQWIRVYAFVSQVAPSTARFVCYEQLCDTSNDYLERIFRSIAVPIDTDTYKSMIRPVKFSDIVGVSEMLRAKAAGLYDELRERSMR